MGAGPKFVDSDYQNLPTQVLIMQTSRNQYRTKPVLVFLAFKVNREPSNGHVILHCLSIAKENNGELTLTRSRSRLFSDMS